MATLDSANNSLHQLYRPRFTLRSFLLGTTLLSAFLGIWLSEHGRWTDAWRAAVTVLLACGLVEQIQDWRSAPHPFGRSRIAWEIGWRLLLAGSLVLFAAEKVYEQIHRDEFRDLESFFYFDANVDCGWLLIALFILARPQTVAPTRARWRDDAYSILLVIVVLLFGMLTAGGYGLLEYLVAIAVDGVQLAQPAYWNGKPFHTFTPFEADWGWLHRTSPIALGLLAATWLTAISLRTVKTSFARVTLVFIWLMLIGALAVLNHQANLILARTFPFRQPLVMVPYYLSNLVLIVPIFAAGVTVRLLRSIPGPTTSLTCDSPLKPHGSYTHERLLPLLLLGVIAAAPLINELVLSLRYSNGFQIKQIFRNLIDRVAQPVVLLSIVCVIRIASCLWQLRETSDARKRQPAPTQLPFLRGVVIWIAAITQLLVTIFTLYWVPVAILSGSV